jgi:hypothetical protein
MDLQDPWWPVLLILSTVAFWAGLSNKAYASSVPSNERICSLQLHSLTLGTEEMDSSGLSVAL